MACAALSIFLRLCKASRACSAMPYVPHMKPLTQSASMLVRMHPAAADVLHGVIWARTAHHVLLCRCPRLPGCPGTAPGCCLGLV